MSEPTMETLARRLDGVERENRWLKRAGVVALVGIAAVVLMGQAMGGKEPMVISSVLTRGKLLHWYKASGSVVLSELKPDSDSPGDEEAVTTIDVEVREIKEQARFKRGRVAQSIFRANPEGDQEARIVSLQVGVDKTDASLEVGFEAGIIDEIQGIFRLGGDADLEEIAGDSELHKRADRNIMGEKVVTG